MKNGLHYAYPNPSSTTPGGMTNAQMVYTVYGAWMSDNNQSQVDILNQGLADTAPRVPQKGILENLI